MNTRIIDSAFWGTTPVVKLYQGSELVWPLSSPIPSGPGPDILLRWISNGNARTQPNVYFDTRYTPSTTIGTCVDIKYSYETSLPRWSALFGALNESNNCGYIFNLSRYGSTNTSAFRYRNSYIAPSTNPSFSTTHRLTTCIEIPYSSSSNDVMHVTIDDVTTNGNNAAGTNASTGNMALFACRYKNNSGEWIQDYAYADTRIYYVKIYGKNDPETLYRYLIPVLHYVRAQNKYVPCFYDKVSNSYFYNLGTDDVSYGVQGDYLLDYIERDNSGYLTYTTAVKQSNSWVNELINMGFSVGDENVEIQDLGFNPIMGANDSSTRYGLCLPGVANSSTLRFMYYDKLVSGTYDYSIHDSSAHHCDHIVSYTLGDKAHFSWLNVTQGELPNVNTSAQDLKTAFDELAPSPYSNIPIVLFGNTTQHALNTTKIFYVDFVSMPNSYYVGSYKHRLVPKYSYIPVLHNGRACFYDYYTNTYIFNTGPGTPSYKLLEEE